MSQRRSLLVGIGARYGKYVVSISLSAALLLADSLDHIGALAIAQAAGVIITMPMLVGLDECVQASCGYRRSGDGAEVALYLLARNMTSWSIILCLLIAVALVWAQRFQLSTVNVATILAVVGSLIIQSVLSIQARQDEKWVLQIFFSEYLPLFPTFILVLLVCGRSEHDLGVKILICFTSYFLATLLVLSSHLIAKNMRTSRLELPHQITNFNVRRRLALLVRKARFDGIMLFAPSPGAAGAYKVMIQLYQLLLVGRSQVSAMSSLLSKKRRSESDFSHGGAIGLSLLFASLVSIIFSVCVLLYQPLLEKLWFLTPSLAIALFSAAFIEVLDGARTRLVVVERPQDALIISIVTVFVFFGTYLLVLFNHFGSAGLWALIIALLASNLVRLAGNHASLKRCSE